MNAVRVGDVVLVRTPSEFNGSNVHPGVVTHVWSQGASAAYANVKVLPDCGAPYDETSVNVHETQMEGEARASPARYAFLRPEA